ALQAAFAGSREIDVPIVNAMEIADHKQHYPRVLDVIEARRAYQLFEKSIAGRPATAEEENRKQELLAAIGRAVLPIPERAASTPGTPFDGLLEIPTATVLGQQQAELVPKIFLLGRGDVARPKEEIAAALPTALAEKTERDAALPGPHGSRRELALWLTK